MNASSDNLSPLVLDQEDFKHFLQIFEALDHFEASQYSIRGYGAFDRTKIEMPDPSVVKVLACLKARANVL